jgi:hypothetical protein
MLLRYTILWAILISTFAAGCVRHTTPCVYEFPDGYSGWVVIEYGKQGAPALPVVDGRRVIRLDETGYLATSTGQEFGILDDRFVYIGSQRREFGGTSSAGGPRIWARRTGSFQETGSAKRGFDMFFVGSDVQYKEHANPEPQPQIGLTRR